MKVHHIRNACMIIEFGGNRILVDPCLNPKGSLPPYTVFRKPPRLNPTASLPPGFEQALAGATAGLVTHCRYGHFDHLDKAGVRLLAHRQIPAYCSSRDEAYLKRRGIRAVPLAMNEKHDLAGWSVTPFPTAHGYGLLRALMGPGAGYFIEPEGDRTVYISGDTVLTPVVRRVLKDLRPDIAIVNAGTAALDLGRPILMPLNELLDFMGAAPGKVIAVHLDAFNHCLTTRAMLRDAVSRQGLSGKVAIPEDGEELEL
jgi:L-ascorbate metabolism protein UlaG (beta-lactamase superfamily)